MAVFMAAGLVMMLMLIAHRAFSLPDPAEFPNIINLKFVPLRCKKIYCLISGVVVTNFPFWTPFVATSLPAISCAVAAPG